MLLEGGGISKRLEHGELWTDFRFSLAGDGSAAYDGAKGTGPVEYKVIQISELS